MAAVSKNISKTIQALVSDRCNQKEKLRGFAEEIVAELSAIDPSGDEGILDLFVSELVLSAADQRRKGERHRHQMECIAAAKARGVRFGSAAKALPENFHACREAWRSGEMTLREAAGACGMPNSSFRDAVIRVERAV